MEYILQNEFLTVRVDSLGAELKGLYSHQTGLEYLWQPGHEIWDHSSLLLFPNPGRIAHDRILVEGKPYPARMHGFACHMEFSLRSSTDTRLVLALTHTPETLRSYPYRFCLEVEFLLEGDTLTQHFHLSTPDEKPLYYSLGAHPAFYCPLVLGERADSYRLVFDRPQQLKNLHMQPNTRLLSGRESPYLTGDTINLSDSFFDGGPLLLGGVEADTITLRSTESGRFLQLGMKGFPTLCLWGMPTQMSIIAIEPWLGPSDRFDTDHNWQNKPGVHCAQPGQRKTHTLTFRAG